jgi:hypothetical protein
VRALAVRRTSGPSVRSGCGGRAWSVERGAQKWSRCACVPVSWFRLEGLVLTCSGQG